MRLKISFVVAVALWTICWETLAQNDPTDNVPSDKSFSIQLFRPAPGPLNFLSIEGPEIGDDLKPSVGAIFLYQHRPFVLFNCDEKNRCGDEALMPGQEGNEDIRTIEAVKNLITVDALGSFNFLKIFQVGLAVPVTIFQRGEGYALVTDNTTGSRWIEPDEEYTTSSMGDLRLHLKARILGKEKKNGLVLSAAVIPTFPIWHWAGLDKKGYGGEGFMTVTAPKVMVGYRFGPVRIAANAGLLLREKSRLLSAETGHSIDFGGAIGYSVIEEIELIAELYGSKSLVTSNFADIEGAPLLFLGGGRFMVKDLFFTVGAGGGIISGVGVPQFQITAGAGWAPKAKEEEKPFEFYEWDIDGDGIDNEVDECPDNPEDKDNFQDDDGCPDTDNDNDGIVDGYDSCPMAPEDKDNFRDDDGCPDLDHDEDGIKEPADKCPDAIEDFDGFDDEDGCPDEDNDKDGFADPSDFCPDQAEDKDNYQDDDGCPDMDNDNDGVPDSKDNCPDQPETLNGLKDDDGCPDKGNALVIVTDEKIELKEMVQFESNSSNITGAKSFEVLDIVATILMGNTSIQVSIEGHTDDKGNADRNRELSKQRADSVKSYLVGKGVDEKRLETVGWGPDKPKASNKTPAGRKENRRVEFIVIKQQKTVVAPEEKPAEESTEEMDFSKEGNKEGEMDFTAEDKKESGQEMDFTAQ